MWIFLEIITISFIILFSSSILNKIEKIILYLVVQTLGSIAFLLFIYISKNYFFERKFSFSLIFLLTISLKIGLFPLHLWILKIGNSFTFKPLLIFLSWQKTIPIFIFIKISYLINLSKFFLLSILVGTISLISINSSKKIILLSSISHSGWIIITNFNIFINLYYFTIYCIILIAIILFFKKFNSFRIHIDKSNNLILAILLFSLGGIPPLLGFFPKWNILEIIIIIDKEKLMLITLIIIAIISFFIYSQLLYNFIVKNSTKYMSLSNTYLHIKIIFLLNILLPIFIFSK